MTEKTRRCRELPAQRCPARVAPWGWQVYPTSCLPCWLQSQWDPVPFRDLVPQIPRPRWPQHPQLQPHARLLHGQCLRPQPAAAPSGTPAHRHLTPAMSSFPSTSISQMPPSCHDATRGAGLGGFPSPMKNNHCSDFRKMQPKHRSYFRLKDVPG